MSYDSMNRAYFLEKAGELISGQRASDYGDARLNHQRIADIWGVDYDSSIDKSNKIRSSIGVGIDWFSVVGPINFSLSQNISKADTDITESFRFNIGTTF